MIAVGAYIFAGGFTVGVKRAGFEVVGHLEDGDYGVETSQRNHPGLEVWRRPEEWPNGHGIDFVYSNPPCAPWSAAGLKGRDFSSGYDPRDPRVSCFQRAFGLLERLRPRVLAIESVTQAYTRGRPMLDAMSREAEGLGYATTFALHDAYDCGLPQRRRRVFAVFHDVEMLWERPAPGDGPRTVREALAGLVDEPREVGKLTPSLARGLHLVKPGEKLRAVFGRAFPGTPLPSFLRQRLHWDRPSPTHLGAQGTVLYHPDEDREISVREAQVLCGYPASYEFVASTIVKKHAQVAQAVTPPAGAWIAATVRRSVEANSRPRTLDTRTVDYRA